MRFLIHHLLYALTLLPQISAEIPSHTLPLLTSQDPSNLLAPPPQPKKQSHHTLVSTALYDQDSIDSWPDYFDHLDEDGLAPLTKEVQKWIWERQNPKEEECEGGRFLVTDGWASGLGSAVHVIGHHLGSALEDSRILLYNPSSSGAGSLYADPGCNRSSPTTTFDCFFRPLSTCSHAHALSSPDTTHVKTSHAVPRPYNGAPTYWRERLREELGEGLTDAFIKYWWRAQSAAYVMRLNGETAREVRALRMEEKRQKVWTREGEVSGMPFPLPGGVVGMHVRHGDKGHEMNLVPLETFMQAFHTLTSQNPLHFRSHAFISSENPSVIASASHLPTAFAPSTPAFPTTNLVIYTTDIPRINTSPFEQLNRFGKSRMTHFWLLQMMMQLECSAWIGTRGSNWNRLVDELRCVWVDRCAGVYVEVGSKGDWGEYNW
ncbi:uncharacterized protein EV422DRAFT_78522 [Fimicolochytrium jonesii]|uniref:uncharacterized protein n=1 Tax=Fimicolochytrium jonesii TaxID=1396493 RepID=UPI0022FF07C1|nr:uncharacterized protein EV422DRAFT_78522 [Fimicolochytrium jonesii]KAI8820097.1 hypothetical protein EV422DRAFT_78522 [Fimicolochytrium jonesii]